MPENNQMIEQIFASVDAVGSTMEDAVDLSRDVAPFMFSTLAKIKQLALAKNGSVEAQYDLFQVATNYLPRTINAYCAFPIEYRNTRIIESGKTARELLIEDLKIFKTQVLEIEKQFYASLESQVKVNSTLVREKYDNKFQLATELEQTVEDGFVNQFDFSTYQNSSDYKAIQFKKHLTEKEIKVKERNAKVNKSLAKFYKASVNFVSSGYRKSISIFKKLLNGFLVTLEGLTLFIVECFGPIVFFGGLILFACLLLGDSRTKIYETVKEEAEGIYDVMKISTIPTGEFAAFVKAKEEAITENSDFRKERVKIIFNDKARTVTINVSDLEKNHCRGMIDHKERNFDNAIIKVNGIDLPQDNLMSDYTALINENHKICHLKEGNKITLEFDNQKIYDAVKNPKPLTAKEKEAKLENLNNELSELKLALTRNPKEGKDSTDLKWMILKVENAIESLKNN